MKQLSDKLADEILEKSEEKDKDIALILINPALFNELTGEKDILKKLVLVDYRYHKFIGIPMWIDSGVDTWEIRQY